MTKRSFPLSKVYRLLEPGPVVLLTTRQKGHANVMTMSWHTMMDFEPPLVGCVDSSNDFSFEALTTTRECVLNAPTVELAAKVVQCGNASGRDMDKFAAFGLTPLLAAQVGAPLIDECYANLECRVADTRLRNQYCYLRRTRHKGCPATTVARMRAAVACVGWASVVRPARPQRADPRLRVRHTRCRAAPSCSSQRTA